MTDRERRQNRLVLGVLAVLLTNVEATWTGQLVGLAVIFAWVFGVSLITWFVLKATMAIRVTEEEEYYGVDVTECGMEAYPEFGPSLAH
jgi:ammonium transporter, Amt family